MGQLKLSGTLSAGPTSATDGTFPAMVATTSLSTKSNPKPYGRSTGILERTETFVAFTDLGEPGNAVKQPNFLYFRSAAPVELRLTTDDGAGGDVVAIVPVDGLAIMEFDNNKFLKLLELFTLSAAVQFEYLLSGDS